jgi:hypothetical protein
MNSFVDNVLNSNDCYILGRNYKTFYISAEKVSTLMKKSRCNVTLCIRPLREKGVTPVTLCLDRQKLLKSIMPEELNGEIFYTIQMDVLRRFRFSEEQLCNLADDEMNFHIINAASGASKSLHCVIIDNVVSLKAKRVSAKVDTSRV